MKFSAFLFIIAVIASSCCSAKQTTMTTVEKPQDIDAVTEVKPTVSHGTLIGTTEPVKTLQEKSDVIIVTPSADKTITEEFFVYEDTENLTDKNTSIKKAPRYQISTSEIHRTWNTLLTQNVSANGNVNYDGFKKNHAKLKAYITQLGEHVPQDFWTREDKLSYWMNAYNAMTIDLILRNQPVASIKDIKNPWEQRLWKLGDKYYNLDEIEHQILRKMGDARIHFGINCASFSCPPLLNEAFMPAKVDAQLDKVSKKFINDTSRNMISENSIEISKIFSWFSKDFKQNGSLIDFLNKYSTVKISEDAKVRYMDYDWELNN